MKKKTDEECQISGKNKKYEPIEILPKKVIGKINQPKVHGISLLNKQ